mmetsp:Transcript_22199/g.20176  ORF Transcript_22199/g.20176 Transcript_22199/m.20176 type:complete len:82 (-) Transcript_22199:395-640(-)
MYLVVILNDIDRKSIFTSRETHQDSSLNSTRSLSPPTSSRLNQFHHGKWHQKKNLTIETKFNLFITLKRMIMVNVLSMNPK